MRKGQCSKGILSSTWSWVCMCVYTCAHVCTRMCMCTCAYVCVRAWVCSCIHICVLVYVHAGMRVCWGWGKQQSI